MEEYLEIKIFTSDLPACLCGIRMWIYFYTKYISLFWEDTLYQFARHVEWMTVSMHHSLTVLLGHTSWIVIGSIILYVLPRPQPFFNNNQQQQRSMWFTSYYQRSSTQKKKKKNDKNKDDDQSSSMIDDEKSTSISSTTTPTSLLSSIQQQQPTPDTVLTTTPTPTKQYKQWIGWVLGGYFVSCWCYNISDYVNSYLLSRFWNKPPNSPSWDKLSIRMKSKPVSW
eukprot:CAMPEP_0170758394 /NCGR_PEP_ID=MMETSP0733-20121128/287_1 /TAXON_ID=186038 /ORGANISM="Fragilariopsis kerguelensis, Strain L26-C5" /LENGTH=224 /DNA_ID=CAMNT_0011097653 /DNA_START=1220 /DNA_END=1891 /DNA_ORIENTATION=-